MASAPVGRARKTGLMMRDPYEILGLAKTASAAEIKSAYRKLAKKYHPDQSKEARAKERFSEIGSAYEILGDEKKRGAYDRGEIDAEGKPRAPQFEGFGYRRGAGQPGEGADFRHFGFDFGGGRGSFRTAAAAALRSTRTSSPNCSAGGRPAAAARRAARTSRRFR